MKKKIAVLPGDGIGPEIIGQAVAVLGAVCEKYGHIFDYEYVDIGGCSIDKNGVPITDGGMNVRKSADAVLLGAVGGPKWDGCPADIRPEKALLAVRKELGLFANLRPVKIDPLLSSASPLKTADGTDLVIVRELTGGVYFGKKTTETVDGKLVSSDLMIYSEDEIERIARIAFDAAMKRRKKVASVDKANVLETSRLWRKVVHRVGEEYPEVELCDVLVDNAAMQLIRYPGQFDVIVTENMFGDILSDEASMITGSIGMMPSASLCETGKGMYEPIHGSAPDIAGLDIANPIGTVLSAAMMLRYTFNAEEEAKDIESAVGKFLSDGYRTADIMQEGCSKVGCSEAGKLIIKNING